MGETGQLHVWGSTGCRESLFHPAQVGVESAAGMLDRFRAVLPQNARAALPKAIGVTLNASTRTGRPRRCLIDHSASQ